MADPFVMAEADAKRREDARGWLAVIYESETMVLKRSYSRKGVFRGLHAQTDPSPQVKVIRVVSGRILDFVVALDDPTRTIHHRELGPENGWVRIDAIYAHGFYALEDCLFEYVCDGGYDEPSEQAFSITDYLAGTLGITDPILSEKDRAAPPLRTIAA